MKKLNNGSIKLAIQKKGRLTESTIALLRSAGLEFESYQQKLFATCRNFPLNIVYLRDDDIPDYVAKGAVDLGIVGENILIESGSKASKILSLPFGYFSSHWARRNAQGKFFISYNFFNSERSPLIKASFLTLAHFFICISLFMASCSVEYSSEYANLTGILPRRYFADLVLSMLCSFILLFRLFVCPQ